MSLQRESREAVVEKLVCYCDRCGKECPELADSGFMSGRRRFHCGSLSVRRTVEGGKEVWAIGGSTNAREYSNGYEASTPTLCLECLDSLSEWLGGRRLVS